MKRTWWLIRSTDLAWHFWLGNPYERPIPTQAWVPKKVVRSIQVEPLGAGTWQKCEVVVEDWFLKQLEGGAPRHD